MRYFIVHLVWLIRNILKYKSIYSTQYIVFEEQKLIYIPVSKCGNTAIKECLTELIKKEHKIIKNDVSSVHAIDFPQIRCAELPQKYLKGDYTIFAVIRNPLDRLISCYFNQVKPLNLNWISGKRNSSMANYLFGYLNKNTETLEKFLIKILKIPKFLMEPHFKPFSTIVRYKSTEIILIDLEYLEVWFEKIRNKFNLKPLQIRNKENADKNEIIKGIHPKILDKIKYVYKKDYELYDSIKNKPSV